MVARNIFLLAALLTAIAVTITGNAAYASAETDFNQGAEYFKTGSYKLAVDKFESARQQGMQSIPLYYNLGSSYYKLGDYNNAKVYFNALLKSPELKSLAEYNLGLIALKQNNETEAQKYFNSVIRDDKDSKLVYLSRKHTKKSPVSSKPWSVYTSAKLGYDENINAAPSGAALDLSDTFLDVALSADYLFTGNKESGWIGDLGYYTTDYMDEDRYDFSQYVIGVTKANKLYNWQTYVRLNLNKSTYGNEDYQTIIKLDLKAKHNISKNGRLYLRYRYDDISSDSKVYDYLDGWRQKISARFKYYGQLNISQITYEVELNDRNDIFLATSETSYSPTRHTISTRYTQILSKKWHLTGDLTYRKSDYPATITQNRNDERWKLSVYADHRLDKTTKIRSKLSFTDNSSNEPDRNYNRSLFSLEISKLF